MKKQNLTSKLWMLCLVSMNICANAQELQVTQPLSPNQAITLAKHDLPKMLQLIEPEDIQEYGFDANDNFANIQIGQPFYVTSLPHIPSSTVPAIIETIPSTIMLPVILDNKARCLLYVSQEEGTWKVVGIGEAKLVNNQQEIFNTNTNDKGESFVIVNVPQQSQLYAMILGKETSFQPLFQFEHENNRPISIIQLIEINNAIPQDAMGISSNGQMNENTDQPTHDK